MTFNINDEVYDELEDYGQGVIIDKLSTYKDVVVYKVQFIKHRIVDRLPNQITLIIPF